VIAIETNNPFPARYRKLTYEEYKVGDAIASYAMELVKTQIDQIL
jgi:hypothetical protein